MDCSAFRRHHVAYVDDTLPRDVSVAAARHAAECPACARHDTAVRRSLLLARNACGGPALECSPDFAARLEARLRREAAEGAPADRSGLPADDWTPSWREVVAEAVAERAPSVAAVAGHRRARQALAAAAVVAVLSAGAALRGEDPGTIHGLGGGVIGAAPAGAAPAGAAPATYAVGTPAGYAGYDGAIGVPVVDAPVVGGRARGAGRVPPFAAPVSEVERFDAGTFDAGTFDAGVGYGEAGLGGGSAPTPVAYDAAMDAGALVAPAAVGVPVWAAVLLAGEVPAALWRGGPGASAGFVRVGH